MSIKKTRLFAVMSIIFLIMLSACIEGSTLTEFTITFDSNGGSQIEDINVESGQTVSLPIPDKEGYTFDGWYTGDGPNDVQFSNFTPVLNDINLFAKWTINQYTIAFDSKEGSLVESISQDFATALTEPIAPTKVGYTLDGWYFDQELTIPFAFNTMPAEDFTIYAKWTINQYIITFNSNDGSLVDAMTQDYATVVLEPIEPTRNGYTFDGWYSDISLTNAYTFATMPHEDLSLYAKWDINTYDISYMLDDGINDSNNTDTYTVVTPSILLEDPTKEGYTFLGWYDNAEYSGESMTEITSGTTRDMTLYAKWSINSYDINYNIFNNYDPLATIPLYLDEAIININLEYSHSSALTSTGRVFIWGSNYYGQLGDGTTINKTTPIEITSRFNLSVGETIISINLGSSHSSALSSTGRIFSWGSNYDGQLGDGTTIDKYTPTEITNHFDLDLGETIITINLGSSHSSALTSTGRMFTWGANSSGQLGDGTTTNRTTPVEITGRLNLGVGETVISINLGYHQSSAISSTGRVFTLGANSSGQLGDGTTTNRTTPVEITGRLNLGVGETVISINLGVTHSSALTSAGRMFTWGANSSGQLGDGTTTNRTTPVEITGRLNLGVDETITSINLGSFHSSALTSTGRVFTWGYNEHGELGDGTTINKTTPTEITSLFYLNVDENIISVNLGVTRSSALTSAGRVFAWGSDYYEKFLNGITTSYKATPTEIKTQYLTLVLTEIYNFSEVTEEYMPILDGYNFSGWYSDSKLTVLFVFDAMPASNIVLYGRWILIE